MPSRSRQPVAKKRGSRRRSSSGCSKGPRRQRGRGARGSAAAAAMTFAREIFATLGTISGPGRSRISVGAVRALDLLISGAFHLLADAAGRWQRVAGRRTLSVADLADAVDRVLPRGHAARADYEGRRALARLAAATATARGRQDGQG